MTSNLDQEEKRILKLFEEGKLKSTKGVKKEIEKAKMAAEAHLKKDARINIRLSQFDLNRLKRIAASEGLPYQTLISSVLHKFARHKAAE